MGSLKAESPIYDIKISTVGPGLISGQGEVQELTGLDLAMKLHYLRIVYYFRSQAFEGLTVINIKETLFYWLNHAYVTCGRFRRSESGRPFIKCNDCGVRFVEGRCSMSLDEWLELKDDSRHKLLVSNQVIGPDLAYSPLVLIQLTKFKCGGTSVGVTWAHVLGDAFSAAAVINIWGQATRKQYPAQPLQKAQPDNKARNPKSPISGPLAVKRVNPVGDLWANPNTSKMETFSFHVSGSDLTRLKSKIQQQIPPFESICTVVWQCVAKVKPGSEPKVVTICKRDSESSSENEITNRNQVIKVVKTDSSVTESSLKELGLLLINHGVDDRKNIEEEMGANDELPDFLIYGANLTFVDLFDAPFYELNIRGQTPVTLNCFIDNIGVEGVVLVLPTRKDQPDGMTVSVTLLESQISGFKSVLKEEWSLT